MGKPIKIRLDVEDHPNLSFEKKMTYNIPPECVFLIGGAEVVYWYFEVRKPNKFTNIKAIVFIPKVASSIPLDYANRHGLI